MKTLLIRFSASPIVLWCLSLWICAPCLAQAPSASLATATAQQTVSTEQPPFDRLELLAFVAGQFSASYASQEIRRRGADFTPDAAFLSAVRSLGTTPDLLDTLRNLKPRAAKSHSPEGDEAYATLLRVIEDLHKKHFVSAGEGYQQALQFAPNSATLHLAYAVDLLLIQNYREAEVQSRRSLEFWPDDAEAHVMLASALSGQNRDTEAIPEAREALRIFPQHKFALVQLGFCLTRGRQFAEAIPVLREAISRTPEMPLLHKHLGISLFHTGEIDGAIEELTVFLKTNPNDAEAHYDLGAALRSKDRQSEAQAQFREAARLEPTNPLYATVTDPGAAQNSFDISASPRPDAGSISGNLYTNTFFGFSFEFPKGWTVLSADAARSTAQLGGALLANGDPMLQDVMKTGVGNSYPLLFVIEGMVKNQMLGTRSIQIHALDKRIARDVKSGEDFLRTSAVMYKEMGMPLEIIGTPEELPVGGRSFWKANLTVRMNNGLQHGAEIATVDKGFVLLFVFVGSDAAGLEEIVKAMQSVRFLQSAN
jgi:tetratricopeptide (TPR) repeat protein